MDSPAKTTPVVLVVEDEALIRMLVVDLVRALGCTVLDAGAAPAGLALLRQAPKVDLLLTDVGLPGMDGYALMEQARQERPGLRVVLMTGYTGQQMRDGAPLPEGVGMLTKPFTPNDLSLSVRRALG